MKQLHAVNICLLLAEVCFIESCADNKHEQAIATYHSNKKKEERNTREIIVDSTGKPTEVHVYSPTGKLFYADYCDSNGHPSSSGMLPLFEVKDTIAWGEKMSGFIWFGYPLKTKATLLIGTLGKDMKSIDRYPMLDTLQLIEQSRNGRFYFSFQPAHAGANIMGYKFLQPESPWDAVPHKDSLSVDHLSGFSPFFVRGSPKH